MAVFQLVRRGAGRGALAAVEEPPKTPDSLTSGVRERLGSQGVLRLCRQLATLGYEPFRVTLVDSTFEQLEEDDELVDLKQDLLEVLSTADEGAVDRFIFDRMEGVYALQVDLRDPVADATVSVMQDGVLMTDSINEARRLPEMISRVG
jgi:hypothetical protein